MEEDGQWSGVGSEDDDLGDTAVEGLGGLVGTLLQLAVVGSLLDDVEDLLGEVGVGDWPGWGMLVDAPATQQVGIELTGTRVLLVRHFDRWCKGCC